MFWETWLLTISKRQSSFLPTKDTADTVESVEHFVKIELTSVAERNLYFLFGA